MLSIGLVFAVALWTGTLDHPPTSAQFEAYGFGFESLRDGKFQGLVAGIYFVDHPAAAISSIALIGLFVGLYEYRYGLRWTIAVWFVGTLATTFLGILLVALVSFVFNIRPISAIVTYDVGASASCWCALGAIAGWPVRWRGWRLVVGVGGGLVLVALGVTGQTYTDVGHIIAFCVGVILFGALESRLKPSIRIYDGNWLTLGFLVAGLSGILVIVVAQIDEPHTIVFWLLVAGGGALILSALNAPLAFWPFVFALVVLLGVIQLLVRFNGELLAANTAAIALILFGIFRQDQSVPTGSTECV